MGGLRQRVDGMIKIRPRSTRPLLALFTLFLCVAMIGTSLFSCMEQTPKQKKRACYTMVPWFLCNCNMNPRSYAPLFASWMSLKSRLLMDGNAFIFTYNILHKIPTYRPIFFSFNDILNMHRRCTYLNPTGLDQLFILHYCGYH